MLTGWFWVDKLSLNIWAFFSAQIFTTISKYYKIYIMTNVRTRTTYEQGESISQRLGYFISNEDLVENAAKYPEMQQEYSPEEAGGIARVKEYLLAIPLVHTTHASTSLSDFNDVGLLPHRSRPEGIRGNSYGIDTSLGLDEYAFAYWGMSQYVSRYDPKNSLLIDARLLLEPEVLATPGDLFDVPSVHASVGPFEKLDLWAMDGIRRGYLNKIVSGKDWLEIMARRIYTWAVQNPDELMTLIKPSSLGEIKHLGAVDRGWIMGMMNLAEHQEYWYGLIKSGFMPAFQYLHPTPTNGSEVDYLAMDKKIEMLSKEGRSVWRNIIENEV